MWYFFEDDDLMALLVFLVFLVFHVVTSCLGVAGRGIGVADAVIRWCRMVW